MKKLVNLFILTLFITLIVAPSTALGSRMVKEVPEENFAYIDSDDKYWAKFVARHPDYVFDLIEGKRLGDYIVAGFVVHDGATLTYSVEWVNPNQVIVEGTQAVQIRAQHDGTELVLTGEIVGIKSDEPTGPSLTATTILLESRTMYDVNLNNKVTGSKYNWTSSNPNVAKVNAKNGLVTAVSEGEALVTCEIALPDGKTQTLNSVVTVGYDENAPLLTETILDLEVGDKFDINLENKIAKSKYRWVSSDRSIVTVNSANGKITAKLTGEAYVTCTITTPDNQIIVLRCDINVTK